MRPIFACLLLASLASVPQLRAEELLNHPLTPDDNFDMSNPAQERVFEAGPKEGSQALNLKETDSPQSGVSFRVDTRSLEEGTAEIWFYPEADATGSEPSRVLLNLGSAGNTKWQIALRDSRLVFLFNPAAPAEPITVKSPPIDINAWHHAAVAWSPASGIKFYLDGECFEERGDSVTIYQTTSNEPLQVGDAPEWTPGEETPWISSANNFVGRVSGLLITSEFKKELPEVTSQIKALQKKAQ